LVIALATVLLGVAAYLLGVLPKRQPAWMHVDRVQLREAAAASDRTLRRAARTTSRGGTAAAAAALEQAIRSSKRRTLAAGARPIPAAIRQKLADHFPDEVLEDVRWSTAGRRFDIGSLLAGWYLREGAVTLDDAIVFSNERTANHWGLWAHELTHVVQYRELGVGGFARLYTTHWPLLEGQADRNTRRVIASVNLARRERASNETAQSRKTGMQANLPLARAAATSRSSSSLAPRGQDSR